MSKSPSFVNISPLLLMTNWVEQLTEYPEIENVPRLANLRRTGREEGKER
jgi:hypothetical protein